MNLPELSLAFLGCPADLEDPAPAIDWLSQSVDKLEQRNAVRFLAVNTKFKAPPGLRTINVGTNYPSELALLATHANWTKAYHQGSQQYRDAQALFCLHRFVQAHPDVERIVLIAKDPGGDIDIAPLLETASARPFQWLESNREKSAITSIGPIVFNRSNPDSDTALKLALNIALTGAIYGLDPYSLEALLDQSTSAAAIVTHNVSAGECGLKS